MFRLLFGSNGTMLRSIISKCVTRMFRKYGLDARVKCEDFVVYREGDELLIHVNGDFKVKEADLLEFLNKKMDVAE